MTKNYDADVKYLNMRMEEVKDSLNRIEEKLDGLDDKYVKKSDLKWLWQIVFLVVGIIGTFIITKLLDLI
jgi:hypothetical protein